MTTLAQSTVKTVIQLINATVSPHVVLTIPAVKGFSPAGGGKRKKIDTSTMDSVGYNENLGGRADPPEAAGSIILMKSLAAHQAIKAIFEAQANGTLGNFDFVVMDSDGTGNATIVTGALQPPQSASPKKWTRSGMLASGYIATLTPKYEDDDVIRADFGIQISGKSTWFVKGEIIAKTY